MISSKEMKRNSLKALVSSLVLSAPLILVTQFYWAAFFLGFLFVTFLVTSIFIDSISNYLDEKRKLRSFWILWRKNKRRTTQKQSI